MQSLITQQVRWQDLRNQSRWQVAINVCISLPFLLLSWWGAWQGYWLIALLGSFFFFTAALRQAHDCYHNTLGVSRRATQVMLLILSIMMLCSTHAIRYTHLNHHRDPLGDSDVEGNWARLPWYRAIAGGAIFSLAIQWFGLTQSNRHNRRWVYADISLIGSIIVAAILTQHPVLVYHVGTMLIANMLVGFFAVWTVHHDCDDVVYARSERHAVYNALTFNLLYHMEHHTFPAVPTSHLPQLAQRLDAAQIDWQCQPVIAKMTHIKKPTVTGSILDKT